jgi:hypothetical protein
MSQGARAIGQNHLANVDTVNRKEEYQSAQPMHPHRESGSRSGSLLLERGQAGGIV